MNRREYERKQIKRENELLMFRLRGGKDPDIINLEFILCSIRPYSLWWRHGYIHSLRRAIKALERENENGWNDMPRPERKRK